MIFWETDRKKLHDLEVQICVLKHEIAELGELLGCYREWIPGKQVSPYKWTKKD